MQAINLTPHVLNIYSVRDSEPVLTIASTGFARAEEIVEQIAPVNLDGTEVPVVRKAFAPTVNGLPEPQADTIYVVSFLTAQAVPDREDVFFPGEAVRDPSGKIIGCVGLSRV
jgi:hypothetical protein